MTIKAEKYITQVLVRVRRGITDDTPTLVFPWEVPILEAVHGEGNVIEADERETMKWLEMTGVHQPKDTTMELHGGSKKVIEMYDPSMDIGSEYVRLQNKYGMHFEKPIFYVEDVYGPLRNGQFEAAVLENIPEGAREGRMTRILAEGGADTMNGAQVRAALDLRKIKYKRTGSLTSLRALLDEHLDHERAQLAKKQKAA